MPNPPGISTFRPRTATLIPDFDTPFVHSRVTPGLSSVATLDYDDNISKIQAETIFGTLAFATGTVTIGGVPAPGDTITLQVLPCSTTIPAGKGLSLTIVVGAAPTPTTVAVALAAAINSNAAFARIVDAFSAAAVVTLDAVNPGLLGNNIAVVVSKTGAVTVTASGANLAGATGTLITPLEDVVVANGRSTTALFALRPISAPLSLINQLKTSMLFVV